MATDLEIARARTLEPLAQIARRAGVSDTALLPYGRHIAKLDGDYVRGLAAKPKGKLILVTAINPTPAGEGKTTTTIGLGDALNHIGRRAVIALREPSLGPVFGRKGGATGGGLAQVAPMEQINLHFTGDFHAITSAHNLLAAMLDNSIYWGNPLKIDPRMTTWRRVLDMNDRALRQTITGVGEGANGLARETGFDITVASEVMAILCLARDLEDLEARLARIVVARDVEGRPVTAAALKASGAMAVLLKDALQPNLVQTLSGSPALIHGGPFANIAHGCNSAIATKAALALGEFCVTEAGFGADLGAEKFLNIKCRQAGVWPSAAVVVATVRALKMQGGAAKADLGTENLGALERGLGNLGRHVENLRQFGLPVLVAINAFDADTPAEQAALERHCEKRFGVETVLCRHWAEGAPGAAELARKAAALCDGAKPPEPHYLYPDEMPLDDKIKTVATKIYRAGEVTFAPKAARSLRQFAAYGYAHLPVCMAKTPYSFSTDEALLGAPEGHALHVREARLSAGAGFVVAICGEVMTMPGLPREPAAERIHLGPEGLTEGLF
jgi:formate--tetrahydrofolate ligase